MDNIKVDSYQREKRFAEEKTFYEKMKNKSVLTFLKEYLKNRKGTFSKKEIEEELKLPEHMNKSYQNPIAYALQFFEDDGFLEKVESKRELVYKRR